tara:strand:+ start:129 stop:818 length:690 start_codon:yes stop_codon:yes gene_type:complete
MAEDSETDELPFFQSLAAGGLGAVDIDKWKTVKYGFGFIVFIYIIIAMNSNSWYSMVFDDDIVEFNFGLNEVEVVESEEDDGFSDIVVIDYSKCYDQLEVILNCEEMDTSGNLIKLSFLISISCLATIFSISICRGFGKLDNDFFNQYFENIEKIGFVLSSSIIVVGLFIYALMMPSFDHPYIQYELPSSGLGSTWWMMFWLSSLFTVIVFNKQLMLLIETVSAKLNKE